MTRSYRRTETGTWLLQITYGILLLASCVSLALTEENQTSETNHRTTRSIQSTAFNWKTDEFDVYDDEDLTKGVTVKGHVSDVSDSAHPTTYIATNSAAEDSPPREASVPCIHKPSHYCEGVRCIHPLTTCDLPSAPGTESKILRSIYDNFEMFTNSP